MCQVKRKLWGSLANPSLRSGIWLGMTHDNISFRTPEGLSPCYGGLSLIFISGGEESLGRWMEWKFYVSS
jgi:hypothetical protein